MEKKNKQTYTKAEVQKIIAHACAKQAGIMQMQKKTIDELKNENQILDEIIKGYEEQEQLLNNTIKILADRIEYLNNQNEEDDSERKALIQTPSKIKPVMDTTIDDFLNSDISENSLNAFAKRITNKKKERDEIKKRITNIPVNESGFDLNEAISTTASLEEIMKDFKFTE